MLPGGNIGQDTPVENNSMNFLWVGILIFAGAFFLRTKNKEILSSSEEESKVSK